jgi:hypothetical protein
MTDKLSLYNGALRVCSQRAIASLSENTESRKLLDAVWNDTCIDFCLEQGFWTFATRTVELVSNSDYDPEYGFKFVFDKPDDYVKTVAICVDDTFDTPLTRFVDEGGFIACEYETIYLRYVSNDDLYGNNLSKWSPTFVKFVQTYLASQIIGNLSQDDRKVTQVAQMYAENLRKMQSISHHKSFQLVHGLLRGAVEMVAVIVQVQ